MIEEVGQVLELVRNRNPKSLQMNVSDVEQNKPLDQLLNNRQGNEQNTHNFILDVTQVQNKLLPVFLYGDHAT